MADYLDDILIIAGLVMLAVGLWQLSPPIMFITIGAIMLLMGIFAAWRGGI